MISKKLYRSTDHKMLFGVCAGLGDFFGIDATLVRLAFIALGLLGGHGILLYFILLIIVPRSPVP